MFKIRLRKSIAIIVECCYLCPMFNFNRTKFSTGDELVLRTGQFCTQRLCDTYKNGLEFPILNGEGPF